MDVDVVSEKATGVLYHSKNVSTSITLWHPTSQGLKQLCKQNHLFSAVVPTQNKCLLNNTTWIALSYLQEKFSSTIAGKSPVLVYNGISTQVDICWLPY